MQQLLEEALASARLDKGKVFLDLFGGVGHISRRVRRKLRGSVVLDIAIHPLLDILSPTVQNIVLGWVRAGVVFGLFMAPFCGSWSRARMGASWLLWAPVRRSARIVMSWAGLVSLSLMRLEFETEIPA